jgi:hypothetical protein
MTSLKILGAEGNCGITHYSFSKIDLVELDATNNTRIRNINHMKSLKRLIARMNCGIDQNGIRELDLNLLDSRDNYKIMSVEHMKSLKYVKLATKN